MNTDLSLQLKNLPDTPGVYLFKDTKGKILYVGKAKVLKHRVRSYFQDNAYLDSSKRRLVKKITDLETITTDTEQEALILEANLIQKHQPPYNVILRDDKFYLFIKITSEKFPRVFLTRRLKKDGSRYFGPYSSAQSIRRTLRLLQRLFPHRGEKQNKNDTIFPHPLFTKKLSPPGVYRQNILNIIRFLKGDRDDIVKTLHAGMRQASLDKHYERAAVFRDQIRAIEKIGSQQKVYLPSQESLDIISLAPGPTLSAANVFSLRQGKLLNKNTFILNHRATTSPQDSLRQFILQYYAIAQDIPPIIALPLKLEDDKLIARYLQHKIHAGEGVKFIQPQRGLKKDLVKLGLKNAELLLSQEQNKFFSSQRVQTALQELSQIIGLNQPARRVETYDISNIQGQLATGSMIVFIDGRPEPKLYKKFRIKNQNTPNDFAALKQVLIRRFSGRHIHPADGGAGWPLPDLIIIDGGKGQLSSAKKTLDQQKIKSPVISIAKKLEEIFIPGQPTSIRLPYDSDALYLIQRLRDEAHRFTITYHRSLRSKQQKQSFLDEIPGIGPKTKKQLLNHFGSLKNIRTANESKLIQLIGPAKTRALKDHI